MSIGPTTGVWTSAAGSQAAQFSGSDLERAGQDSAAQARRTASNAQADQAAGIAKPDGQELQSNDRDGDGRRLWEFGHGRHDDVQDDSSNASPPLGKDASGTCGNELDLTG